MQKFLLALALGVCTPCEAQVVVDGVPGGDSDGVSPFESLSAGVNYAVRNSIGVVEITTSTVPGGFKIEPGTHFQSNDLIVRGAEGVRPILREPVVAAPQTNDYIISLENLEIRPPKGFASRTGLFAAGNVSLNNVSIVVDSSAGSGYPTAVSTCYASPYSTGSLTISDSYIQGHNSLLVGRGCHEIVINDSTLLSTSGYANKRVVSPISHLMNWESVGTNLGRLLDETVEIAVATSNSTSETQNLIRIQVPRSLVMNRTILNSQGAGLQWPGDTLESNGNYYYGDIAGENTVGPVTAINSGFTAAIPSFIGNPFLSGEQNPEATFVNCIFRSPHLEGAMRLRGSSAEIATFYNCLFDIINNGSGLTIDSTSAMTAAGDGNIYSTAPGNEYVTLTADGNTYSRSSRPAFETTYTYAPPPASGYLTANAAGDPLSANARTLLAGKSVPVQPAVTDDIHGTPRPIPAGTLNDVGTVEFDQGPAAAVENWLLY